MLESFLSPIWRATPNNPTVTKFCLWVPLPDIINCVRFYLYHANRFCWTEQQNWEVTFTTARALPSSAVIKQYITMLTKQPVSDTALLINNFLCKFWWGFGIFLHQYLFRSDVSSSFVGPGPVLSKHNILFGGKKEGCCCPHWTAAQLPEVWLAWLLL